jgi:polyferredoxin
VDDQHEMNSHRRLIIIKLAHTVIWAFFASCIVAIPFAAWLKEFRIAFTLAAIVLVEVFVLLIYRWNCPLTAIAARYTDNRNPNFDIYLPKWLAQHNKLVFGSLYIVGVAFMLLQWSNLRGS